jgi:low affinity Fe/Cu permease
MFNRAVAAIPSSSGRKSSHPVSVGNSAPCGAVEKQSDPQSLTAMVQPVTASHLGRGDNKSEGTTRNHAFSTTFAKFAHAVAHAAGTPTAFLLAMLTIAIWAITGPVFGYSDTWQLVINTGTTIVTFLMVFLIQNTQNRDALAVQLKLSELIIAVKDAENRIATIEDLPEEDLEQLHKELTAQAEAAGDALASRRGGKAGRHKTGDAG